MPEFFDISHWNQYPWFSTGGTRAKKYLQSPDGKFYYFKRSQLKPGKDYKFEFWSEIIAYEIGTLMGFPMLRYDIAVDGDIMGCISESMINPDKEELIEGVKYLQGYDNSFNPSDVKLRHQYTFQLIDQTLKEYNLEKFLDKIIEMIIFDSIIGNSDRHQENWAFISEYTLMSRALAQVERTAKAEGFDKLPTLIKRIYKRFFDKDKNEINPEVRSIFYRPKSMAPIYDNGSSLGRELETDKIEHMLSNKAELEAYVKRGTCEIHWVGEKISHFEMISRLLNSSHAQIVNNVLDRVIGKFEKSKFESIIAGIDTLVPENLAHYQLPSSRKNLIVQLIDLRLRKLGELV